MASPGIGLGVSSDAGGVFGYVGLCYSAALLLLMQPARHAAAPKNITLPMEQVGPGTCIRRRVLAEFVYHQIRRLVGGGT